MLKKLFKPKWQHKNPSVRKIAVERLDNSNTEDYTVLEQLAEFDDDLEVRRVAASKILNLALLVKLLSEPRNASITDALKQRIAEALCDNAATESVNEKQQLVEKLQDESLCDYILKNSNNIELQTFAAAFVNDPEKLADLAMHHRAAKVRQAVAERIDSDDDLHRVAHQSKGKDKSVYRIVKEKIDARREIRQKEQEEQAECKRLCDAIESQSRIPVEPLYEHKLRHILKQWQELESQHKPLYEAQFAKAQQICEQALAVYQEEEAERIAAGERNRSAETELSEAFRIVNETIQLIHDSTDIDLPAIQGLLATQKIRWQEAAEVVEPDGALRTRFEKSQKDLAEFIQAAKKFNQQKEKLEELVNGVNEVDSKDMSQVQTLKRKIAGKQKSLTWPPLFKAPALLSQLQGAVDQLDKFEQKLLENKKQSVNAIEENIQRLKNEIQEGHLKAASKKLKDTQNLLRRLPQKEADHYNKELRMLSAQLNELRDWQGFATTPKKEQLCEQMEALIDADMPPQEKADQIKLLQEEWKNLGQAEPGKEQKLWIRFREAGDKAFEPCRSYFQNQAGAREENLQKRIRLCDQLELYIQNNDWGNVSDWGQILEMLKVAKAEWRDYSPVERSAVVPVQERFDKLLEQLQGKLDAERQSNADKKQALIDKVKALLDSEDLDGAINETKALQQDWKNIGMVQRRLDNQLWGEFRKACDAIFERRQQRWDDARAVRDGNQEKAEAICAELEQQLQQDGKVLLEQKGLLSQFKERFAECQPLPKAVADSIRARFNKACGDLIAKLDQTKMALENERFEALWDKASLCSELEKSIINSELQEDRLSQIKEQWTQAGELPDAAAAAMNARFDFAIDAFSSGKTVELTKVVEQNTEKRHELALKMEIVAGVDSPSEDQKQRMELQVNRLNQNIGTGNQHSNEQEKRNLLIQWCATGPVDENVSDQWVKRFKDAYYKQ